MAQITDHKKFIEQLTRKPFDEYYKRFRELSGLKSSELNEGHFILMTFENDDLLQEHNSIKNFKKTSNRYYYHSEQTHPPVKAHYHIIPNNGNYELYAVNIDGTAHHKINKGYEIPKKEAKELRELGVKIPSDNIIEMLDELKSKLILEYQENKSELYSIVIEID